VADRRILRLIQKWLKAGVSEEGRWSETEVGTPQGAVVSPLLANVYLHYVFDLWVEVWRKKMAKGDVIVVRYADDLVLGFQHRTDAERFLREFRDRLAKFGLELHVDKTRLIDSLGFTHFCGQRISDKAFIVWRITPKKRMVAKLKAIKAELQRRKHHRTTEVGSWLRRLCWATTNTMPFRETRLSCASFNVAFAGYGGASLSVAASAHRCDGLVSPQS
jgi:retron-type reverse transcriptase